MRIIRARVEVSKITDKPLPYNYPYWLASMILRKLRKCDSDLSQRFHAKRHKFYTFSNLIIDDRTRIKNGLQFKVAHFYISSPNTEFIRGVVLGMIEEPSFKLSEIPFIINRIETLKDQEFPKQLIFRTISPIYVKTRKNGKEWDLYPKDPEFYGAIFSNLLKKYRLYYDTLPESPTFTITNILKFKARKYEIKGNNKRCSEMVFEVKGCPELIKFAFDVGLGQANAMGFGCVDVVKSQDQNVRGE